MKITREEVVSMRSTGWMRLITKRGHTPMLLMDNLTTWNIRGFNSPNKLKEVKSFCWRNKIGLLPLMETKVHDINYDKVASNFTK